MPQARKPLTAVQIGLLRMIDARGGTVFAYSAGSHAKYERLAKRGLVSVEPHEGTMTLQGRHRTTSWKVSITSDGKAAAR